MPPPLCPEDIGNGSTKCVVHREMYTAYTSHLSQQNMKHQNKSIDYMKIQFREVIFVSN